MRRKILFKMAAMVSTTAIMFGCLTGGTHGSIKAYHFPVRKAELQNAVTNLIKQEPNLRKAAITDTFTSKYYNDGERYITLDIGDSAKFNEYVIQFTGDKQYWDTAKSSEISIAYAYDKNGNGGSMGNGRFMACKADVRKEIVDVFEIEFIRKIDSVFSISSGHDSAPVSARVGAPGSIKKVRQIEAATSGLFFKGQGVLGVLFEGRSFTYSFTSNCHYFFPIKYTNDKIIMYWSEKKDCDSYRGFKDNFGSISHPVLGKPFGEFTIGNGDTLRARYYYPDWIAKINALNRTNQYTDDQTDSLFASVFVLVK